ASPRDITRIPLLPSHRGALQQLLCRADTGAMTAIGYTGIRGWGHRPDPTLAELRCGTLPVRITRPDGGSFEVGEIDATLAEIVLYRSSGDDGTTDLRFTLGIGATPGRVERRAIAAAILDGNCARARGVASGPKTPVDDAEFLSVILESQEASGFVEHLRLPHYVTFTSELDRVRAARTGDAS
ncbi:MAG: carbon-phosphorus lyase complex subunit PhnI, partial [Candidatus Eremiobacteraeota bacterium]|nr:carbon-phosphorus lyase complex subunit PhnI [Candidatus Eremiobacteraeota bacterium]